MLNRIKNLVIMGDGEVPFPVRENCFRFYKLGGIVCLVGLLMNILIFNLLGCLLGVLIGLAVASIGYIKMVRISRDGFQIIEGVCEDFYEKVISINKGSEKAKNIKAFIVKEFATEDLYLLPYYRTNLFVDKEVNVRIYLKKNAFFYNRKGYKIADSILGYETF